MNLHIEFIGLHGSGKTTCAKELKKILNKKHITAYTLPEASDIAVKRSIKNKYKAFLVKLLSTKTFEKHIYDIFINSHYHIESYISFISLYTRLFDVVVKNQLERNLNQAEKEYDLSYLFYLCSRFQIAASKLQDTESIIIDEGFTYIPIRTLAHGDGVIEDYLRQYINLIPKPHLVINIVNYPALCEKRISRRLTGYPGIMRSLSYEERIDYLEFCREYIDKILNYLHGNGIHVINVDNSGDIDEINSRLETEVMDYLNTSEKIPQNSDSELK